MILWVMPSLSGDIKTVVFRALSCSDGTIITRRRLIASTPAEAVRESALQSVMMGSSGLCGSPPTWVEMAACHAGNYRGLLRHLGLHRHPPPPINVP